ncbi:hypothetical protein JCGZ_08871 [Jatropha curcas]|uniref:Uncharacterized protein n=1 Tax=Jatropha curcas TaxID=180498 RepID=A0A067KXF6_JATCU|nr:hypothetical protein JCGZ_08871 [Jatropha curcas]
MRHGNSGDNTFAAGEWFDQLPERVQEHVREITITSIDFATITELPSGGWSMVFNDRMRTLDCPAAAIERQAHKRGPGLRAPDTAVVVGTLEHGPSASFDFILDRTGQTTQGMLDTSLVSQYRMSPLGCTHAAHLKLAVTRLSDEHVSRASMGPSNGRGRGMQYGGCVGRGVGCRQLVIKEAEEASSEDSEETVSNMS